MKNKKLKFSDNSKSLYKIEINRENPQEEKDLDDFVEEEPKKNQHKKKLSGFYMSIVIVAFLLVIFLFLIFYIPSKNNKKGIEIYFDPVVISNAGKSNEQTEHLNNAEKYFLTKLNEEKYTSSFDVHLTLDSEFELICTIKNTTDSTIRYNFKLTSSQFVNMEMYYSIDGETRQDFEDSTVINGYVSTGKSNQFKLIAKIEDGNIDAIARANYTLTLTKS